MTRDKFIEGYKQKLRTLRDSVQVNEILSFEPPYSSFYEGQETLHWQINYTLKTGVIVEMKASLIILPEEQK